MDFSDRRNPEDTRARIMATAWDLFRQLGARTTMADVAERLGMSSANVYRYFSSKQALCEAVAAHLLGHLTEACREIVAADAPATERLREVLLKLHSAMRNQMINEARVHEIVDIAIKERWAPVVAYEHEIGGILGALIAEGQARGEFGPGDPAELGILTICACSGVHHPLMIALYDGPNASATPEQIVDFALRALTLRAVG